MLVFAAICPHPPILIPTIGKESLEKINSTAKAMQELEGEIYATKPEVIMIISPHGSILSDAFSIDLNSHYQGSLEEFGDFSHTLEFKSEIGLIDQIQESLEREKPSIPLVLSTETKLDHGVIVPLYYLTKHLPKISIIPIGFSLLDFKTHLEFGYKLKKVIMQTNKRVAVVASGDLSHRLTPEAPAGYSKQGKIFDKKLIEFLRKKNTDKILALDQKLIEEAGECGLRSILILLGILKNIDYKVEILAYEGPFGVGYLVANFKLS